MHKPDGILEYDVREMLSSDPLLDDGRAMVKVRNGLVSLVSFSGTASPQVTMRDLCKRERLEKARSAPTGPAAAGWWSGDWLILP
jgi:hypothetical protein